SRFGRRRSQRPPPTPRSARSGAATGVSPDRTASPARGVPRNTVRTDHHVGILRLERGKWAAYRGVGSELVAVTPPAKCGICGQTHASRREAERIHGRKGRRMAAAGTWPSLDAARAALVAELGPLYSRAADRDRIDGVVPPPMLLIEVIGEGNAWD